MIAAGSHTKSGEAEYIRVFCTAGMGIDKRITRQKHRTTNKVTAAHLI